mmetsp:Transcript_29023/g.55681  ORF Transcript_29023/g.55681 Transcript_29023/m.55681 type:complete len:235 (+) Transcript_29023:626-1330(+)
MTLGRRVHLPSWGRASTARMVRHWCTKSRLEGMRANRLRSVGTGLRSRFISRACTPWGVDSDALVEEASMNSLRSLSAASFACSCATIAFLALSSARSLPAWLFWKSSCLMARCVRMLMLAWRIGVTGTGSPISTPSMVATISAVLLPTGRTGTKQRSSTRCVHPNGFTHDTTVYTPTSTAHSTPTASQVRNHTGMAAMDISLSLKLMRLPHFSNTDTMPWICSVHTLTLAMSA